MIANLKIRKTKKASKPLARSKKGGTYKYIMVTFPAGDATLVSEIEKAARDLQWSRSGLFREIVRKYFGYTSHLP